MIFHELTVGGPAQTFLASQRFLVPFSFPTPVRAAYAALGSFHLEVATRDSEVKEVAVVLTMHFDPGQSATSGDVEVEFARTDTSRGGIRVQSDSIKAQLRILVVGID
jgi:hypothetical protein